MNWWDRCRDVAAAIVGHTGDEYAGYDDSDDDPYPTETVAVSVPGPRPNGVTRWHIWVAGGRVHIEATGILDGDEALRLADSLTRMAGEATRRRNEEDG